MHRELHRGERIGWLRAAVLGANVGLNSTSSLVVGVAAAEPGRTAILLAADDHLVTDIEGVPRFGDIPCTASAGATTEAGCSDGGNALRRCLPGTPR